MVYKINLHNLFHLLKLRTDKNSQFETKQYADAMFEMIRPLFPISCNAFEKYILNSISLSSTEIKIIKAHFYDEKLNRIIYYEENDFSSKDELSQLNRKVQLLLNGFIDLV